MDKPTVSVIIPTHNRAPLVTRALSSVFSQTYQDWECIVVDDASTDNTEAEILNVDDSRVRYIRHRDNRGGSAARNTGIHAARGQFVAFLDSDDEWYPSKIEEQVALIISSPLSPGIVLTGVELRRPQGTKFTVPRAKGFVQSAILSRDAFPMTCSSWLVNSAIAKQFLFDTTLPSCQDIDFLTRASEETPIDWLSSCLTIWNSDSSDHLSFSNPINRAKGHEAFLNKHRSKIAKIDGLIAKYSRLIAMQYALGEQYHNSRRYHWAALAHSKLHPDSYAWALISLAGHRILRHYTNRSFLIQSAQFET